MPRTMFTSEDLYEATNHMTKILNSVDRYVEDGNWDLYETIDDKGQNYNVTLIVGEHIQEELTQALKTEQGFSDVFCEEIPGSGTYEITITHEFTEKINF